MSASDEPKKIKILKERIGSLSKVQEFIDNYPNPSKKGFYKYWTIPEALNYLNVNIDECYSFLSISADDDYHIHLIHFPISCFINNYNPVLLLAFQGDIDIQTVTNY